VTKRLIVLADGGDHPLRPLAKDVIAIPLAGSEAEPLAEFDVAHFSHIPPVGSLADGGRLVDQVIGENGWALGTRAGNGFPEEGLGLPTVLLIQRVIRPCDP
jgi:hypothetical protein